MRQISLTQGLFALVDDADYDWLNQYRWCAHIHRSGNFYTERQSSKKEGKRHIIRMSREILGLKYKDKRQADHRNHNTLDNHRDNIRICTHQENTRNRKSCQNTTSKFKGVHWYKPNKKWHAQITVNRMVKHLGYFISEKLAALAYNEAAKKYFGEFANLNLI